MAELRRALEAERLGQPDWEARFAAAQSLVAQLVLRAAEAHLAAACHAPVDTAQPRRPADEKMHFVHSRGS